MTNNKDFNKGLILAAVGSFWWGYIGVIYFKYIAFTGHVEVVIHRCLWTTVTLILTSIIFSKFNSIKKILNNKKNLSLLFLSGLLIFINWSVWIYAVSIDKIIDASFGYFIMPIISVFLGNIFFKEKLSLRGKISVFIVIISILFIIFSDFKSIPWVGLIVAISWSFYNLVRKKVNVETDIGLLIESLFILPIIGVILYYIVATDNNDFVIQNLSLASLIILAGPMTLIPLFLYVKGVELAGLGPSGMVFFIVPTGQFLLGFFYFNEPFSTDKFISFILIWFAVLIYLRDLYENN